MAAPRRLPAAACPLPPGLRLDHACAPRGLSARRGLGAAAEGQILASCRRRDYRLFVGRLPDHLDESRLKQHFEGYGGLTDVYLPKEYHSGKLKGFGFVTFISEAGISAALAAGVHSIDGVELEVKRAQPREAPPTCPAAGIGAGVPAPLAPPYPQSERLFVGRLPEQIDERRLHAYFERFGGARARRTSMHQRACTTRDPTTGHL